MPATPEATTNLFIAAAGNPTPKHNSMPKEVSPTARNNSLPANKVSPAASASSATIDDVGCDWHTHLHSVLLWDRLNWTAKLTTALKLQLQRGVAEIWTHRTGSKNNRKFVIKCKKCSEMVAVQYSPSKLENERDDVYERLLQVFDFLKMKRPEIDEVREV